jgi:hypothetical protein
MAYDVTPVAATVDRQPGVARLQDAFQRGPTVHR